jgi:hypothetical protein
MIVIAIIGILAAVPSPIRYLGESQQYKQGLIE